MGNPVRKLLLVLRRDGLLRTCERAWQALFTRVATWQLSHLLGRMRNVWRLPALRRAYRGGTLNLGCGPDRRADWLNADLGLTGDLHLDAGRRFPFPDRFFSLVFSEHLLEHLTEPQASNCLRECYRVLQPGGIIHLSLPDLGLVVEHYLGTAPDGAAYLQAAAAASRWKYPEGVLPTATQALNDNFYLWEHRHLYDEAELRSAMSTAGFADIVCYRSGGPVPQQVLELESRKDGSLVAQATRLSVPTVS